MPSLPNTEFVPESTAKVCGIQFSQPCDAKNYGFCFPQPCLLLCKKKSEKHILAKFGGKKAVYYEKEAQLKRRETAIQEEMNTYADLDFDARVNAYVKDLQAGLEELNSTNPQIPEERHALFFMKVQN